MTKQRIIQDLEAELHRLRELMNESDNDGDIHNYVLFEGLYRDTYRVYMEVVANEAY